MTGAITTNSTFDGRDVATDGAKLDGIEAGATADQTQSEINALGITATGLSGTPAISVANITTTGELRGPASFVVDPAAVGDNTGTVIIKGNLQVDGATTTINSTTLTVDDLNITLASGAANGTAANGAGITVDGASATLTYQSTGDNWAFNKNLDVTGNIVVSGTVDGVDIAARDAVLTSTTTTAGAALPKAGGTMTGTLLVTAGNGDQLQLNNAGERFTQISLQHSGTQNGALWLDDTDSMVDLYANTSHGIRLKTGGDNPRVTILSGGNVGIGTDAPAAPLHTQFTNNDGGVGGHLIKNTNTGTTANFASLATQAVNGGINGTFGSAHYSTWGGAVTFAGSQTNHPFKILTNNAVRATFDTSGNVGIGTTAPSYKLALKDNSASAYPLSLESGTIGTPGNHTGIRFGFEGNTYQKGAIIFEGQDANGRGKMYFAMEGSANSSNADETDAKMTIDYSGKVGIGTTAPTSKLSIQSGISSSSTGVIDILQNTNGAQKQAASIGILVNNGGESTNAAGMFFQTASGGSLSERMRLTSSGGLELGYNGAARQQADSQAFSIITPASGGGQGLAFKRLDSNNDQGLGEISWSNNTQDGQANIRVKTAGAVNSTDMHFDVNNAGTLVTALSIDGSAGGNVGIGTDSPDGKFVVSNGGEEGIEFFPRASAGVNSTQHYDRNASVYLKNRTIALNHEWVNGSTDPAMNLIPDGNATFLLIKAKAGTFLSTANLSLYGTNPNANGGSLVSRATVQAVSDGTAFGTKMHLFTNNTSNVETKGITIDAAQKVGIGTDTPTARLHVTSNSYPETNEVLARFTAGVADYQDNRYVLLENTFTGSGYYSPALVFKTNANGSNQKSFGSIVLSAGGNLSFQTKGAGNDVAIGTDLATIERLQITTSGNTEVRSGGSLRTYRPGNSAYAGLFMDTAEDLYIRNSYSTKDIVMTREGQTKMPGPIQTTTDSGTRMFTGLATGSFYNSTGFLILRTNIPAHNSSNNSNMFSLSIEGFGYSNSAYGIIDMNIGCYSGENNYYNASYSGSNIPNPWINNIYFAKHDSSGTLSVIIGTSSMSIPAEIACTKFIQGYVNVNEDYANGWDWITTTSVGDYSQLVKVQPKNTKNPRFAASTNTGFSVSSGSWQKISDSLSENVDTAGVYNGTSGRFTPTMEGYYQFNFGGYSSFSSSTGQERYALAFAKNGTLQYIFGGNYSNADSPLVGGSQSIYLDNNDYVELWCYSSVTATWGASSHKVWWEGYWTGS